MHHLVRSNNELIRQRGYRLTPQRYMILSVIQEANEHLSIEQILERVQAQHPCVSLSTVYRTLELLRKLGMIREVHFPGDSPHFEAAGGHAHHHLVCSRCRTTIHLAETLLGDLNEQLQAQYHFHNLTLDLVAAGYCENCWQQIQQEQASSSQIAVPSTSYEEPEHNRSEADESSNNTHYQGQQEAAHRHNAC